MEYTSYQLGRQRYIQKRVTVQQVVDGFTPCWVWNLTRNGQGYGVASDLSTAMGAHRLSYKAYVNRRYRERKRAASAA